MEVHGKKKPLPNVPLHMCIWALYGTSVSFERKFTNPQRVKSCQLACYKYDVYLKRTVMVLNALRKTQTYRRRQRPYTIVSLPTQREHKTTKSHIENRRNGCQFVVIIHDNILGCPIAKHTASDLSLHNVAIAT